MRYYNNTFGKDTHFQAHQYYQWECFKIDAEFKIVASRRVNNRKNGGRYLQTVLTGKQSINDL